MTFRHWTLPTGHHLAITGTVDSLLHDLQTLDIAHWTPSGHNRYSGQLATTRPSNTGHHLAITGTMGSFLQPDHQTLDNAHWITKLETCMVQVLHMTDEGHWQDLGTKSSSRLLCSSSVSREGVPPIRPPPPGHSYLSGQHYAGKIAAGTHSC